MQYIQILFLTFLKIYLHILYICYNDKIFLSIQAGPSQSEESLLRREGGNLLLCFT